MLKADFPVGTWFIITVNCTRLAPDLEWSVFCAGHYRNHCGKFHKPVTQSTQDAPRYTKEMEPIDVNGSVHTACKQHQRKNVLICVCVCVVSRVLCGLGLMLRTHPAKFGVPARDSCVLETGRQGTEKSAWCLLSMRAAFRNRNCCCTTQWATTTLQVGPV